MNEYQQIVYKKRAVVFEIRKLSPLRHISIPSLHLQGCPFDFACHAHERIPFAFCSVIAAIIFVDVGNIDHLL